MLFVPETKCRASRSKKVEVCRYRNPLLQMHVVRNQNEIYSTTLLAPS